MKVYVRNLGGTPIIVDVIEFPPGGNDGDVLTLVGGVPAWAPASGGREVLTANRTYYVRTDGNDSNTGLVDSAGGAFLTIQKAVDVATSLDLGLFAVTIQVRTGNFNAPVVLKSYIGAGPITIIGDTTTPANVSIAVTSNHCFAALGTVGKWVLAGIKVATTTSGYGIRNVGSDIDINRMEFGACANSHMISQGGSIRTNGDPYRVSGGAVIHAQPFATGVIDTASSTVTIVNTPLVNNWAFCSNGGGLYAYNMTFSGAVAGGSGQGLASFLGWVDTQGVMNLPGSAGAGHAPTFGVFF
jgi:hypothetical protein